MVCKSIFPVLAALLVLCLWFSPAFTVDLKSGLLDTDSKYDLVYVDADNGSVYYMVDPTNSNSSWVKIGTKKGFKKVVVADFDDDNYDEIVGVKTNNKVFFPANDGLAMAVTSTWTRLSDKLRKKIFAAQVNNDGKEELLSINPNNKISFVSSTYVFGTTTTWDKLGDKKLAKAISGDFDSDSSDEIIGLNPAGKIRYISDTSLTWDENTTFVKVTSKKLKKIYKGDFDGDGTDELVGLNNNNKLRYLAADSADWSESTTLTKVGYVTKTYKKLTAGDWDGDGKQELALIASSGRLKLISETSAAVWDETTIPTKVSAKKFKQIIAADIDGDSVDDIIGLNNNYHVLYNTDSSQGWSESTTLTKITKPGS